ncbi:MAG: hypothetical protein HQL26_11210, partial [Candidatus Omnitrophica bacterium]|nr:hypothetical protein [Candidatus Omnitrophota bacterium]
AVVAKRMSNPMSVKLNEQTTLEGKLDVINQFHLTSMIPVIILGSLAGLEKAMNIKGKEYRKATGANIYVLGKDGIIKVVNVVEVVKGVKEKAIGEKNGSPTTNGSTRLEGTQALGDDSEKKPVKLVVTKTVVQPSALENGIVVSENVMLEAILLQLDRKVVVD